MLGVLLLGIALSLTAASQAQTTATSIDTAIWQLAARIAIPLEKVHAAKIVFADLKGLDRQTHRVGRWLSDQLADSCNKDSIVLKSLFVHCMNVMIAKDPAKGWACKRSQACVMEI